MRIAYLAFDATHATFADVLLNKLIMRGHEVVMFYVYTSAPLSPYLQYPCINERWNWFELGQLNKFNPDRILMFNGCKLWTHAARKFLEHRKDLLTIERGWLPQKNFNYLADGLAPYSFLEPLVGEVVRENRFPKLCEELKKAYVPKPVTDENLPDSFIFYPCQLDTDTSIIICAPDFKTNDSLIGYLKFKAPDIPLVVKNHPLEPNVNRKSAAFLYKGGASSLDLMAKAGLVVGNTSTCLCEALALGKSVVSFGDWIGRSAAFRWDVLKSGDLQSILKEKMDNSENPEENGTYSAANAIYRLQWDMLAPPEWVADLVEQHFREDRIRILRGLIDDKIY
jgi:hypothetical protein